MAKRTKKTAPLSIVPDATSPAPEKAPRARRQRTAAPAAQPLPGHEKIVVPALERLCVNIANLRADAAQIRSDEGDDLRASLREMHENNLTTYRAAGVELVLVPGEERLRVRTSKEAATAETPA